MKIEFDEFSKKKQNFICTETSLAVYTSYPCMFQDQIEPIQYLHTRQHSW